MTAAILVSGCAALPSGRRTAGGGAPPGPRQVLRRALHAMLRHGSFHYVRLTHDTFESTGGRTPHSRMTASEAREGRLLPDMAGANHLSGNRQ